MAKYNFENLFNLAKERGFEGFEVSSSVSEEKFINYRNGKLEGTSISISTVNAFAGIKYGNRGVYKVDFYFEDMNEDILSSLDDICKFGKPYKVDYLTKGKQKYNKIKQYPELFKDITVESIREKLEQVSQNIYNKYKDLLQSNTISLGYETGSSYYANSEGCENKGTKSYLSAFNIELVFKDGETVEADYDYNISMRGFMDLNIDKIVQRVVKSVKDKLVKKPVKSGDYKVILSENVVSTLLSCLLGHLNGKTLYENRSLLKPFLEGQDQLSSKLNVVSDSKTQRYYTVTADVDNRPVPNNVNLIKKGQVVSPILDNEYGALLGKESNGLTGASFKIKPGKTTFDEAVKSCKKAIYINDLASLHSCLDEDSLDFSCPFEGYLIKNGEMVHQVKLGMVSGNVIQVFKDIAKVLDVSDDKYAHLVPKLIIKAMKITC